MKFTTSLSLLLMTTSSTSLAFSPATLTPASSSSSLSSSSLVGRSSSLSPALVRRSSTLAPEAPTRTADDDDEEENSPRKGGRPTQRSTAHKITAQTMERHLGEQLGQNPLTTTTTSSTSQPQQRLVPEKLGPLSMSQNELAAVLGGKGRAQIVWDCYRMGVDPAKLFGSVIKLGWDDYESVLNMLPSNRRQQRLGPETIDKLASLYQQLYGEKVKKVEGGVATLSFISRANDGTTKLLLRLSDGLEVETVIIPWKGTRSTLCISSQVGCRQGTAPVTCCCCCCCLFRERTGCVPCTLVVEGNKPAHRLLCFSTCTVCDFYGFLHLFPPVLHTHTHTQGVPFVRQERWDGSGT